MANPPFQHSQRNLAQQQAAAFAAVPAASNPFIGGWQPLAPRKFPPSLLSVDSPPRQAWELLVLPSEDQPAYFRSQRWPFQKTIVSVDNPPPQDDERAAVIAQVINAVWNAPIQQLPQLQRKIAATIQTGATTAADWTSAGVGTAAFIGSFTSVDAPPAFSWKLIGSQEDSPIYYSARKQIAATLQVATFATGDWLSTGAATAVFVGAASDIADWSSAGVAAATFNGAAADTGAWSAVGISTVTWNESSVASADWNATGTGTTIWVGQAQQPGTADWLSTGAATAAFVGASKKVTSVTRDGWRVRAKQFERRRRKDEDEIMAIAQAVLPLLRRGIRQTTRIEM